jgi:hypothetical protein
MTTPMLRRLAALVVLAAVLPYLPTIDDYFTQDDFGVIQLLSNRPWTIFPRWFAMPWTEDIWGYTPDEIRPFVALTYQLTAIPGRARPELHHILNIAIHAVNGLLVMAIARRALGVTAWAAAAAGIVFSLLPVQAESVAWITGRVDSMPALFYLATFLAYVRWREGTGGPAPHVTATSRWYAAALALFFVALFSKQNTITMVATLAAYDLLVLDRARRGTLAACVKAWLPFAAMTLGYLALRRALFGASVRGGIESQAQVVGALEMIGRHVQRTVLGHDGAMADWERIALPALAIAIAVVVFRHRGFPRAALCFGIVWWIIGAAPVLVAGYESPRHVYLAAAAWPFLLALLIEGVGREVNTGRRRSLRALPIALVTLIAAGYAVRLYGVVNDWGTWSRISQAAVARVAREAAAAPDGTLLLVSVPRTSWEWSAPFVLQPPYTATDLSARVALVTPFRLHCCGPEQWDAYTRRTLERWIEAPGAPPLIALHLAEATGDVSKLTIEEYPDFRVLMRITAETDSWQAMNASIEGLMERVVRRVQR